MAVGVELLEVRAGDLVESIAEKVWAFPHLKRGDLLRIVAVDADGIVSYEMVAPYLRHADCLETFTPTAAVKWMREKPFWVTGVLNDRLTNEARGILVNALKTGEPLAVTVEKLAAAFEPYRGNPNVLKDGEPPSPHRLETIVRTNTTEAYNQGRISTFIRPDMMPFLDGIEYSAILDSRTTEVCRFLDGKIFRPESPDLAALLPPNHSNCRSIVVPRMVGGRIIDPKDFITPEQVGRAKSLADPKFVSRHEEHDTRGAMGIEGFQVGLFRIVERNGGPVL
ncbi:MAG TPA: minor capsid protein [Candidatus Binatia bacterium]|nr:minor capsid protein [Candidatus Binatia bacterium]